MEPISGSSLKQQPESSPFEEREIGIDDLEDFGNSPGDFASPNSQGILQQRDMNMQDNQPPEEQYFISQKTIFPETPFDLSQDYYSQKAS